MGDQATPSSLNLKIIQRYDPGARRIIFTGRHVVLYKFEDGSWLRVGIEGTLFIYESDVQLNLIILNRQNMDNFSIPLGELKDFHTEKDILMFSNISEEMMQFQALVEKLHSGQPQALAQRATILNHLLAAQSRQNQISDSNSDAVRDLFESLYTFGSICNKPDAFRKNLISLLQEDSALVNRLYDQYSKFLKSKTK